MSVITHGLRRVAIYDPTTGTTVRGTLEADNSQFERGEVEPDARDATGGAWFAGDVSRLRLRVKDLSLLSQLETWRAADTRLSAAVEGVSLGILWTETDRLSMLRPVTVQGRAQGRADFFDLEMVREGHGEHAIYRLVNLLSHKADASGASYDQSIVFPVAGATVTAAVDNTAASGTLTIIAKNYAGSTLSSASTTLANGRASASLTLPANTYTVQVTVTSGTSISDISLRLDGSTEHVDY